MRYPFAGRNDAMKITLTEYEIKRCREFAEESSKTQQRIEFGNHLTEDRQDERMFSDTFTGKKAEVAVVKWLRQEYGLHLPVNYEVYPRGEWDDNDLVINGRTVDVKATNTGKWLLYDLNKLYFRLESKTVPSMIVFCKCKESEVEIAGCISAYRLFNPDGEKVLFLRKGDLIPGTKCSLKAANYAAKEDALCDPKTAFDSVVEVT